MNHVASYLREFDGTDVDGLNEQLPVVTGLHKHYIISTNDREEQKSKPCRSLVPLSAGAVS